MAMTVERVSKSVRLPGGEHLSVLQEVSVTFERGRSTAIVGRSGSGKTTLLSILGMLERPDTGQVVLDGTTVTSLKDRAAAALRNDRIGFVFQTYSLVSHLSAAENIELPLTYGLPLPGRERRRRVTELLDRLGLADRRHSLPRHLSGGEQQRVAIGRALARRPAVILADEPTGALDTDTGARVMDVLLAASATEGASLVLVSHDRDVAGRADRVLELDRGRLGTGVTEVRPAPAGPGR